MKPVSTEIFLKSKCLIRHCFLPRAKLILNFKKIITLLDRLNRDQIPVLMNSIKNNL